MTRKNKITYISIGSAMVLAIALLAVWFFFIRADTADAELSNTNGGVVGNLSMDSSGTISLEKKAQSSGAGGLQVNDSRSLSTNLGSGKQSQSIGSNSSGAQQEDFTQYEQYKDKKEVFFGDIVVGTGPEAAKDKQLAVTYKGYLTNGQMFDQSQKATNGQLQPLLFKLGAGQLIPGFEQGVVGMKVGGIRRIIIPPSLGYGASAQSSIPANSVLVFDVELTAAQ